MIKFDKNKKFHTAKNQRHHSWLYHVQKQRHETLLDHPLTTAECDYIKHYMRTHMGKTRRPLLYAALDMVACARRGSGRLCEFNYEDGEWVTYSWEDQKRIRIANGNIVSVEEV